MHELWTVQLDSLQELLERERGRGRAVTFSRAPGRFGPWSSARWYEAPIELVFKAFTDPDLLRQWWGPRDFHIEEITFPAVEGQEYRVRLRSPEGEVFAHVGRFREVSPPHRLSYSWEWTEGPMPQDETWVDLKFAEEEGGTRVELRHSRFPDEATRDAHQGWPDSFERLDGWLASPALLATRIESDDSATLRLRLDGTLILR